ncbi:MAG: Coenzyme F420 hydrogenase/dehydrogenase, beta subunit C-terminal domain [[Clostridium] fimetarium]|nr:Coenzyme F420 hydrogenase/dehydrogenase, beta subunit C-terminal domain [Alistipes timonensis]MCM1404800.1 Coenzyme F420 hydrogenase/dehydrogenase, beta subunit C-terminal domain [[Clostridium] fimetarium]
MPDRFNISKVSNKCYGCGVCTRVCPKHCISLKENSRGFYSPIVDESLCINCGLCVKDCAYINTLQAGERAPLGYYGWSKNQNVRQWCSSGGIGYEISMRLLEKGYKVCAVKYDVTDDRARHYIAQTVDDIRYSVGSKYLPSYTENAFGKLKTDEKWVVVGTPCQIGSLRRYLKRVRKEDNFILVDFFCHGVPSLRLWDKYISELKSETGDLSFLSWRTKANGWHDSWAISADVKPSHDDDSDKYDVSLPEPRHKVYSKWTSGDLFYEFFLGNYCLNTCCYSDCKFKGCNSSADIRLGDYWGKKFMNDEKGVSALISLTGAGDRIVRELSHSCEIQSERVEYLLEAQLKHTVSKPWIYNMVFRAFGSKHSLGWIYKNLILRFYYNTKLPQRLYSKIKRAISK